jgi:enoyl-CoA hydratase
MMSTLMMRRFASAAAVDTSVQVSRVGKGNAVAQVTLNRPEKLNALTESLGERLTSVVNELKVDASVRCVVLTGAGKAFSAGGDLAFLRQRQLESSNTEANYAAMRRFYSLFLAILQLPVPVIAAVNGSAVGAGMCLTGAADLRVVSRTARLGVNFTRLGISPGMAGTHFLPRVFSPQFATWLMLSGELISGEEAHANGFSLACLDSPEATLAEALRRADIIAAASPIAVRQTTRSLRLRALDGLEASLTREADAQAHCFSSSDYIEGLRAIESKSEPRF